MNRTREEWKRLDLGDAPDLFTAEDYNGQTHWIMAHAKADIEELHRKLSCAEAELIRQTGCTAENVAGIYNLPIPKPIVNARMGESHRIRFETEDENARLRAQVAELVEAGKYAPTYPDWLVKLMRDNNEHPERIRIVETLAANLRFAIAVAEGGAE